MHNCTKENNKSFRPPFSKGGGIGKGKALPRAPQSAKSPMIQKIRKGGQIVRWTVWPWETLSRGFPKIMDSNLPCQTIHWIVWQRTLRVQSDGLRRLTNPMRGFFKLFSALFYLGDSAFCGKRPRALPSGHPPPFEKGGRKLLLFLFCTVVHYNTLRPAFCKVPGACFWRTQDSFFKGRSAIRTLRVCLISCHTVDFLKRQRRLMGIQLMTKTQ